MDAARTRAEVDLYGWSPWGQRTLLGGLEGVPCVSILLGEGGDLYLWVDLRISSVPLGVCVSDVLFICPC